MKCKNIKCDNNVVSTGNRVREFCSDRCRMQYKRLKPNNQSEHKQTDSVTDALAGFMDEFGIELDTKPVTRTASLQDYTAKQLYRAINSYPHDTWVNSPEHKELMRRLHSYTVARLKAEGYWIPVWKESA